MARYTAAYTSLIVRMAEVEVLRRSAAQKEKVDAIALRHEINAMCRGALVLMCAHLEAFVKELGEVVLDGIHTKKVVRENISPRIYYHISKDILDEIKDTDDQEKIANKIFAFIDTDLQFWSRSGPFPLPIEADRFNKGFSNPGHEKIRAYFGRFGYSQYNHDLKKSLKAQYLPITNMVDHLVDTRNKIAHGDKATTKTPSEIKAMSSLIRKYCLTADNVFASWCGSALCKIR